MSSVSVNSDTFETKVKQSAIPVLVDFWAEWCNPCRMLAPVLEEISDKYDGIASICKIDVDESGTIAESYGVMSIPTMLIFVNGQEKERVVGPRQKADIEELINRYV